MSRRRKSGRTLPRPKPVPVGHCVAGCGMCCNPVVLPFARIDVELGLVAVETQDRRWVLEDLTPMSRRDAKELVPHHQFARPSMGIVGGKPITDPPMYYRCRNFDVETKECAIYDRRPPACSEYPWYGDAPHPNMAIPPQCGYNIDVGREPVPVVLGPKPG